MLAPWREPWWKAAGAGLALMLAFLAFGLWQFSVVAGGVAGFLSGRGRSGAVRGIQAVAPAWFLWLVGLSLVAPTEELTIILGSILGLGSAFVIFLTAAIPTLLGLVGGVAGGYLAELAAKEPPVARAEPR